MLRCILGCVSVLVAIILAGCPQLDSVGWVYNGPGNQIGYRVFHVNTGESIAVAVQNDSGQLSTAFARFGPGGSILADGVIPDLRNPPGGILKPTATLLSNGDLLLVGTTAQNPAAEDYRLRVLRISPSGNILWDFNYGEVELTPKLAVENGLGNILVAGNDTSFGGSQRDVFFLLLSPDGDIVIFNQLVPLEDKSNFSVLIDGMAVGESFVLGGWSLTPDQSTISVIKLDENAAVTSWARSTGLYERVVGIQSVEDGYAIVASSDPVVQLIKTNESGDVVSVRDDLFTPANPDEGIRANDFIVDTSGDIVIVGEGTTVRYVGIFPQITIRPFIAKFTAGGDKIWERSINVPGVLINGVTETAGGGYATTGATPGRNGDVLLNVIRFDRNGNIVN